MDRLIILGATQADQIELDLFKNSDISLNLSVNQIGNVADRNSTYSNTFTIPRTAKNEKAMDFAGTIGNVSDVPYVLKRCRYLIDTTVIVANGYIKLIETSGDSYRVAVYDGIIDLAVLLGDSTLADLDYSNYNHTLGFETDITDTFSNTWSAGYIYALAEFGKVYTGGVKAEEQAPSIFAKAIWDKIFTSRGLIYQGDFFTTNTDFNELVVPPTKGIDIPDGGDYTQTSIGTSVSGTLNINQPYAIPTYKTDDLVFSTDGYDSNASISSGDVLMAYTGTLELNPTITFTQTTTDLSLLIYKNGVQVGTPINIYSIINPTTSPYTIPTITIGVTSGDVLNFKIRAFNNEELEEPVDFDVVYTASMSLQINTLTGGTLIQVDNYITSTVKQSEFVKDILQRYGLIMIRDMDNPSIYKFKSMEELLGDRTNSVDWTDKLINIVRETYDNSYAQRNEGDYQYISGTVPSLTGYLEVANENAKEQMTLIKSPFEVPNPYLARTIGTEVGYEIPIWEPTDTAGVFENIETKTKLMRINSVAGDLSFSIWDNVTSTTVNPCTFLSLVDMDYQYFFDTYYSNFELLLSSYKEIEIEVYLDLLDYNDLDFRKLVYLKQTGRYYYLDSVRLNSNKSTAKLIEIRNFNA